jgi:hypothetical protein
MAARAASASPRIQRRSLRSLRVRSSLPRYAVYAVAAVAIARILLPSAPPPRAALSAPRSAGVDLLAESFAVDFARAYLAYDASEPQQREALLAPFVGQAAPSLDQQAGVQLPGQGSNRVTFAQVVAARTVPGGELYTVQADTTADGTTYLGVTVTRGASGALELVGEPAVLGPPAVAPAVPDPSQQGEQVSDPTVTAVVTRAITNYLRGDEQDLTSDLATGIQVSPPSTPLSGIEVGQINWLSQHSTEAQVGVDVQVSDRSGAAYGLHYTVSLERQSSRWFVSGIDSSTSGVA